MQFRATTFFTDKLSSDLIFHLHVCICCRGKILFGFADQELLDKGGYDLIHPDDLNYYAAAHQECELNRFSYVPGFATDLDPGRENQGFQATGHGSDPGF